MAQNLETVTLDPLQGGGPGHNWKVSHGTQSGNDPPNFPKVHLTKDLGPYLVTFEIKGSNSITFSNDPIWVQPGSKPNHHVIDSQIAAVATSTDGKQLFIVDKNNKAGDLYYQLNFNGYGAVDPIINNGGGTTPPLTGYYYDVATLGIAAAALVAIIYVAFQQSSIKQIVSGIQRWTSRQ